MTRPPSVDRPPSAVFVAVEGIDGSGKSGVVRRLVDHLSERGRAGVATREPGGTPEGDRLRGLLLPDDGLAWDPVSELLLMNAARVQHVRRLILPSLADGTSVVSDRFVGSTLAYQGAGRGLSQDLIRSLHAQAVDDLQPDLTIVLDLDVATALSRSRRRLADDAIDEGRFEALDADFHERVRRSYRDQAARDPARFAVVDAEGTIEEVRDAALAAFDAFSERVSRERP